MRRLLTPAEAKSQFCTMCGTPESPTQLTRTPNPPGAHVKEVIDTGRSFKRIERFEDIEELVAARGRNNSEHKR